LDDQSTLPVLHIPYARVHFLVNRLQAEASVFAAEGGRPAESAGSASSDDGSPPAADSAGYFGETITVGDQTFPLMDFDRYVCDLFHLSPIGKAQLAVVVPVGRISDATRRALLEGPLAGLGELPGIAIRVASDTAMQSVPISHLAPHCITVRNHLVARGVLAVHPEGDSFGFLVDVDPFIQAAASAGTPGPVGPKRTGGQ
jgi:hypothetical protein